MSKRLMKHGLPKKTKDDCPRPLDADEKTTPSREERLVPPPGYACIQQGKCVRKISIFESKKGMPIDLLWPDDQDEVFPKKQAKIVL